MSDPEKGNARPKWRILLWLVIGALGAVVVITGAYYFDQFTEGSYFCGVLCHPNRPEGVTHEVSAHAEVECGMCHVGPGLAPKVTAKIFGVREMIALVTNSYGRPIEPPVERLRPAREICEQCHWPTKFWGDRVAQISHFAPDESNSETQTYLVLRTGGGDVHPKGEPGIHWHIDNPVFYIARDAERQDIPWVGVLNADGSLTEYLAVDNPPTEAERQNLERREMDCLDCHNRATHEFRRPDRGVDEALTTGRMDRSLPFIKREAVKLLSASYPTQDAGIAAMQELDRFYSAEYPQVYADKRQAVAQAVETLQDIYRHSVFPEMNLTWEAYADNIGHADFAGCFRCHDGQHLTAEGDSIRLHCGICHSIPVVTRAGQSADLSHIVGFITETKRRPESHEGTNFVRDHRFLANDACASCHGTIKFGTDNSGFCANEACHGRKWPGADLDAAFPHPVTLQGKHAQAWCNECHQGVARPNIQDCASCHQPEQPPHFGSECTSCHTPDGWRESAAYWTKNVGSIPHVVAVDSDCASCHGKDGSQPAPATHEGIPNSACAQCHQVLSLADVPTVPHVIEDRSNCLSCHGEDKMVPIPADHVGRTNDSCLLCHEATAGN